MASSTVEVFTVGGGEYLVNVFNAIAGWTGAGGYRGLLKVAMIMAFTMALLGTAWNMDPRYLLKWFLQANLMYMVMMVPTVAVKVTDRTNPSLAPAVVDNVPIGLAGIASFTSQVGDYLTRSAETVFAMPSALGFSNGGMIYGAKLMDATQGLRIDDPVLATNLNEHFKQCVFYDVLMGRKTIGSITHASDMLAAIGPGSVSLSQQFVQADGSSSIVSCQAAYQQIEADWQDYYSAALPRIAQQFFPGVSASSAQAKFESDIGNVGAASLGSGATSAQQLTRQAMMINAMMQARDSFSGSTAQSTIDSFAVTRADIQTRNTYSTIAAGAMKWVPLLNIVLTVVFYALFPIIFLLCLLPTSGIGVIKGYITGFFYLAAWGPLFVILNMIFMTRWQSSLASWSEGGLTAANFAGVSTINQDAGALAGFMIMSVPFIAAGMARGAMSIASHSTSFLAPSQNAAEQAAAEQTTGNYSYGNRQFANLTANQWNDAPTFTTGAGQFVSRNDDGSLSRRNADGSSSFDVSSGMSNLGFMLQSSRDFGSSMQKGLSEGQSVVQQKREAANDAWSTTYSEGARLFDTAQHSRSFGTDEGRSISASISQMQTLEDGWSRTLQSQFGFSKEVADRAARDAMMTGGVRAGFGAGLGISTEGRSTQSRVSGASTTSTRGESEAYQWLSKEAMSDTAKSARESFVRATASSSNSELSGLSRDFQQDLRHAQTVSTEASRAEDAYQRWQTDFSQFQKSGFTLNRNDSQDFVRFSAEQMLDPGNRHLDQSYHPGLVNLTPSQAATQDVLLSRFMDAKIERMRGELGLVPDVLASSIAGPAVSNVSGIRAAAAAGMAEIASRAPVSDLPSSSRDAAVEALVGERLEDGAGRLAIEGRDLGNAVIGARREAESLGQQVEARHHASLGGTMPIIGNVMGALGAPGTPGNPLPWISRGAGSVSTILPASGQGFTTYRRAGEGSNQVGTHGFVDQLKELAAEWSGAGRAAISFGDMSKPGGGSMPGHDGHRRGNEVDVRPFRLDGRNASVVWSSPLYDRATTRDFVGLVKARNPGATILFNDPVLIREGLTQPWDKHDNHLHIRLGPRAR